MIGSIIVLFVLMVYSFIVLDDRISYVQGQSDGGRRNLHQRISTLETLIGELTTSTNNTNHYVSQQARQVAELQKDLDAATERMDLVAEVLKPTVVEDGE